LVKNMIYVTGMKMMGGSTEEVSRSSHFSPDHAPHISTIVPFHSAVQRLLWSIRQNRQSVSAQRPIDLGPNVWIARLFVRLGRAGYLHYVSAARGCFACNCDVGRSERSGESGKDPQSHVWQYKVLSELAEGRKV
jgi:hypothetical protein